MSGEYRDLVIKTPSRWLSKSIRDLINKSEIKERQIRRAYDEVECNAEEIHVGVAGTYWYGDILKEYKGKSKSVILKNLEKAEAFIDDGVVMEKYKWGVVNCGQAGYACTCFEYKSNGASLPSRTCYVYETLDDQVQGVTSRPFTRLKDIKEYLIEGHVEAKIYGVKEYRRGDYQRVELGEVKLVTRLYASKPKYKPAKYAYCDPVYVYYCGVVCPTD